MKQSTWCSVLKKAVMKTNGPGPSILHSTEKLRQLMTKPLCISIPPTQKLAPNFRTRTRVHLQREFWCGHAMARRSLVYNIMEGCVVYLFLYLFFILYRGRVGCKRRLFDSRNVKCKEKQMHSYTHNLIKWHNATEADMRNVVFIWSD